MFHKTDEEIGLLIFVNSDNPTIGEHYEYKIRWNPRGFWDTSLISRNQGLLYNTNDSQFAKVGPNSINFKLNLSRIGSPSNYYLISYVMMLTNMDNVKHMLYLIVRILK